MTAFLKAHELELEEKPYFQELINEIFVSQLRPYWAIVGYRWARSRLERGTRLVSLPLTLNKRYNLILLTARRCREAGARP